MQQVTMGAMCMCSMGTAPTPLMVLPTNAVTASYMPAATIMDNKPFVNILPFALCRSLANPAVASATAAFPPGVLKPQPCTPATPAPWTPGSTKVTIKNMPALTNSSQLICTFGGTITISFPGQIPVQLTS